MVELHLNLVGSRQSYLSYIFILQSTVKGILGVKVDTGRLAGAQGPIVGWMAKSLSSHSQSRKRFFMLNIRRLPITKCPSESFVQRNVCVWRLTNLRIARASIASMLNSTYEP